MMSRNMTHLRGRGKLTSFLLVAIIAVIAIMLLLGMMMMMMMMVAGGVSSRHLPASISFRWNDPVWKQEATLVTKLYTLDNKENQKEGEEENKEEENENNLKQKLLLDSMVSSSSTSSSSSSSSSTVSFIESEMSKDGSNTNLDDDDDNGSTSTKAVVEEEKKNPSSGGNHVQMEAEEEEEENNSYYDNGDYSSRTIGESIEDDKTNQNYRGRRGRPFHHLRKTISTSISSDKNEVVEDHGTLDIVLVDSSFEINMMNNHHVEEKGIDNNKPNNRLLQTGSGSSTTPPPPTICTNVSDTFQTSYAIIFVGDIRLVTPEKANLLAVTFATSYNDEQQQSGSNNNNNKCDPLFRTISEIQVTTNASFTGTNNAGGGNGGDLLLENSIGIIPVRKRKLQQQQQQPQNLVRDHDSNWMDGILWESLLEFHQMENNNNNNNNGGGEAVTSSNGYHSKKNGELYRKLQQQQQQQQQSPQQPPLSSGLNRTVGNYNVGLLLLDIFGTCRGCQGNSIQFELFDDTTTTTSTTTQQQQQQQGRRRYLQQDDDDDDEDDDCICPADTIVASTDLTSFQLSFNSKIEELRDSEELDFVEELDEIIPIRDDICPTTEQDFSLVYLVTDVVLSRDIFVNLGVEGVKEIERLFEDSYNRVAQQLCDPLYRAISRTQLVSMEQQQEEEGSSSTVQIEFVVEATCRGDNCINVGCIFDDVDSCGKNLQQRERNLKTNMGNNNPQHQHSMSESNNDIVPTVNSIDTTTIIRQSPPRLLPEEQNKKDDEKEERCFCRKGRSIRPPTPTEVQLAFQDGLDRITKKNKLSSCQECSFSTDCQSGVCSPAGRCAEADTQLLLNSCICGSNEECESGICQQQEEEVSASSSNGVNGATCQGKLASCRVCNNGDECLSGFCTDVRCAEAVDGKLKTGCDCTTNVNCQSGRCVDDLLNIGELGKCTEKISDTCTEPCLSSSDCDSGLCGSIVCMPSNGSLLAEGCLASLTTECKSGASANNICAKGTSPAPSLHPSQEPSTVPSGGPTTEPSREPTSEPTFTPTPPPTPLPTTAPPTSPPTPNPTESPTSPPTPSPTESPSSPPTPNPTESPTSPPTTSFPSVSPSTSSPSTSPTTSFPPSSSPTKPPTVLEDCRTFPANEYTMDDVYSFCYSHIGEECCSRGSRSCSSWNLSSTYTVCKMACTGPDACTNLGGAASVQTSITIGSNSCVEEFACDYLGNLGPRTSITIGSNSCRGKNACEKLGYRLGVDSTSAPADGGEINIGSNSCLGSESCVELGRYVSGSITIGTNSCRECKELAASAYSIEVGSNSCNSGCNGCGNRDLFSLSCEATGAVVIASNIDDCPYCSNFNIPCDAFNCPQI